MVTKTAAKGVSTLAETLEQLNAQHGAGTVMRIGERPQTTIETISTGSIDLDRALGVGGLPKGRVVEIYGPESSGKTTVALQVIANAQRAGGKAMFIDAEHAIDFTYAANLGVDVENLYFSQPDSAEEALNVAQKSIVSGELAVVVVDSVAALVPRAEINGEIGDSHVGLQARLMGQALRIMAPQVSATNTMLIFINQIREKIGNIGMGSPETQPGGRALKFYASVRLDVRRTGSTKEKDVSVANTTKVTVKKNKVAPPFTIANFDIEFGHGVNREGEIIDLAVKDGLMKKSGAWYYLGDGTLAGQGRPAAVTFLRDNPGLRDELEAQVRAKLGLR